METDQGVCPQGHKCLGMRACGVPGCDYIGVPIARFTPGLLDALVSFVLGASTQMYAGRECSHEDGCHDGASCAAERFDGCELGEHCDPCDVGNDEEHDWLVSLVGDAEALADALRVAGVLPGEAVTVAAPSVVCRHCGGALWASPESPSGFTHAPSDDQGTSLSCLYGLRVAEAVAL